MFEIPITVGEFADRYTILKVKQRMIENPLKLEIIQSEIDTLNSIFVQQYRQLPEELEKFYNKSLEQLIMINGDLWALENRIRECDAKQDFGDWFIHTAKQIYRRNDTRAQVKANLCLAFGQMNRDVKELSDYDQ